MFSPEWHIPFSSLQYLTCFSSFQAFYSKGYLLPLEQCSCTTALLTSCGVRAPGGGWLMAALGTWLAHVSIPPFFFFLIDLYWSIITSQYCVSFCCIKKWISHMHTHVPISPLSWAFLLSSLSHPSRTSESTNLISLCHAAASHQPTILHSVVYICWCYSHFIPASPSHPMSSSPFSMPISLFLPCN